MGNREWGMGNGEWGIGIMKSIMFEYGFYLINHRRVMNISSSLFILDCFIFLFISNKQQLLL